MGKYAELEVKETTEDLKIKRRQTKSHRLKLRLQCLILIKEKKFRTRVNLAEHLGVGIASMNRWVKTYKEEGLEEMLKISSGGNRKSIIDAEIHEGLKNKVNDSENPLMGYYDAVNWVRETYGQQIKYTTLRSHLKRHFKTKLKSPRKSHYKKDEQATEAFLKTARDV